jgi:hypothetical protein
MKRILFFIVMVTLAIKVFGQQPQKRTNETIEKYLPGKLLKALNYEADDIEKSNFPSVKKTFLQKSLMKSQSAIKQRLDSIVSKESMKQLFTYDANGNLNQEMDYEWDSSANQWMGNPKFKYTYDTNGNLIQWTDHEWYSNQWLDTKEEYTYDANGNNTLKIYYVWSHYGQEWNYGPKSEYTYDANGNLTQEIDYSFELYSNKWVGSTKFEYTYNANGSRTQYIFSEWDYTANQWVINYNYKLKYTYDVNGNVTQSQDSIWNENTDQFVVSGKSESIYDTNGNQTQYISYGWDSTSSQWVISRKSEHIYDSNGNLTQIIDSIHDFYYDKSDYTYDAFGNQTEYIYYYWDNTTNQWVRLYKGDYTYDAYRNLTQSIFSEWDITANRWVEDHKYGITYDNNYTLNELLLPPTIVNAGLFKYKLLNTQEYNFNKDANVWIEVAESDYYYSDFDFTATNQHVSEKALLYPNPASENINLDMPDNKSASFELLDMQGRTIMFCRINNLEPISLKEVNRGAYLYNLYFDGKKQSGKLIKK